MTSVRYAATLRPAQLHTRPRLPQSDAPRRALHLVVAAVGLVVAAPLMMTIALVIKLTSRGPVFYTQTRVGLDRRMAGRPPGSTRRRLDVGGKPFTIYNVRTMTQSKGEPRGQATPDY